MLEVVRQGGQQERVALNVGHGRSDPHKHEERGVRHVNAVLKIVVWVLGRIVPLHDGDERADGSPVDRVADQPQVLEEAEDHRRKSVCGDLNYVKVPFVGIPGSMIGRVGRAGGARWRAARNAKQLEPATQDPHHRSWMR